MKFETKELGEKPFVPFNIEITFENEREYKAIRNVLGKFGNTVLTQNERIIKSVSKEDLDIFCKEIDFTFRLYEIIIKNEHDEYRG